jgi:energy-coupling factor transporter transmembrane protein EcfT
MVYLECFFLLNCLMVFTPCCVLVVMICAGLGVLFCFVAYLPHLTCVMVFGPATIIIVLLANVPWYTGTVSTSEARTRCRSLCLI